MRPSGIYGEPRYQWEVRLAARHVPARPGGLCGLIGRQYGPAVRLSTNSEAVRVAKGCGSPLGNPREVFFHTAGG